MELLVAAFIGIWLSLSSLFAYKFLQNEYKEEMK